ncbi:hypothetical protein [Ramlibacter sp. AN1133]|uniref:hypothetical protein n=1 Tax=Ramlibacter sp. AN1133 TaxID=3133429 RepID=UPI0030C4209F
MNDIINGLYLVSGAVLPLFYLPQILRFRRDQTLLASYSLSKAACQLLLRMPALLFALFIVHNMFMNVVLSLDLAGRCLELVAAVTSLRVQGLPWNRVVLRLIPKFAARKHQEAGAAADHSVIAPLA